ncbi:hypothetical protein Tco_1004491 [Tanacetum coccineum]|uniref:Uncharacterized protein n=1 Tax=Tanacetum coccineum TaxID=301880 RepID=A0ABQ5FCS3_9ASTR
MLLSPRCYCLLDATDLSVAAVYGVSRCWSVCDDKQFRESGNSGSVIGKDLDYTFGNCKDLIKLFLAREERLSSQIIATCLLLAFALATVGDIGSLEKL